MPNWCDNELYISGPSEKVKEFWEKCHALPPAYSDDPFPEEGVKRFTMHGLVPVPEEVQRKGYNEAGYDWQISNWGTKWDVNPEIIDQREDNGRTFMHLSFQSAWSPPEIWLLKAATQFPDLHFTLKYAEEGQGFAGCLQYWTEDGEFQVEEECYNRFEDYEQYAEFLLEEMGYEPYDSDEG